MVSARRISLEGRSDGQDSQILDAIARTADKGELKMDRKEAISRIKDHMEHHGIGKYPHLKLKEALDMAIEALSPPNEPLTIEQLRDMDGELVYLKTFDPLLESGWHVIKAVAEDKIIFRDLQPVYMPIKGMGTNYNLYRNPPEEEERET